MEEERQSWLFLAQSSSQLNAAMCLTKQESGPVESINSINHNKLISYCFHCNFGMTCFIFWWGYCGWNWWPHTCWAKANCSVTKLHVPSPQMTFSVMEKNPPSLCSNETGLRSWYLHWQHSLSGCRCWMDGWISEWVGGWTDGHTVYYFGQYQIPCFKLGSCESKVSSFW